MKGLALMLGPLLMLGGGAVAAAQYAAVDLSSLGQAQDFLKSQNALYAGAGAAALGLLLLIGGLLPNKKPAAASSTKIVEPMAAELLPPARSTPEPAFPPAAPSTTVSSMTAPGSKTPPPTTPSPSPDTQPAPAPAAAVDPGLLHRQRISDLVTINDAIKTFREKTGAFPTAYDGLKGVLDRGEHWIPGLVPDYLPALPRDPARAPDNNGPQYQYVSQGSGYKLIVHGDSADGSSIEVLGVKIDPARRNENGFWAYGFWTEDFTEF